MKPGWQVKKLGDVCEFQRGLTYSKSDEVEKSTNVVLRANNIDMASGSLNFLELKCINDEIKVPENKKVKRDAIIICTASGSKSHLGKVAYVDKNYGYAFGGFMGQIIPKEEVMAKYLFYLMRSYEYKQFISELSDGVNINNLKFDDLKNFKALYPPLAEQQRLVALLDEAFAGIDAAKANAEQNLNNARALFDGYLQLVDADKESLGNLVEIKTGKLDANAAVEGGKYPFFTCSREAYAIDNFAFDCEAILLAGNNAVGDFNVKHYNGKFNAYQRTYVITVNEENRVLYRYLYFQMLKNLKLFKEKSVGAGTKFLKLGMIKDMQVALPPLPAQQAIVAKLDALSAETKKLETLYRQKIAALDELKQSLLHQAFTGEL